MCTDSTVGRPENPGLPLVMLLGIYLSLLVEIALTDLPKSGGVIVSWQPRLLQAWCTTWYSSSYNKSQKFKTRLFRYIEPKQVSNVFNK